MPSIKPVPKAFTAASLTAHNLANLGVISAQDCRYFFSLAEQIFSIKVASLR